MLPARLTRIDDSNRDQHAFLETADTCYFFGEYFAYKGYEAGDTNQLIFNYKCAPSKSKANPSRGRHKERAISIVAQGLRNAITRDSVERRTSVPIPPSKAIGDPDYDDRLFRTLTIAFSGYNADVRFLLRQSASTPADHNAGNRLTRDELLELLEIDTAALARRELRETIVLFDDVLTTGKHFKCCESRLRDVVPAAVPIIGLFIARRILPDRAEDFEIFS